MIMTVSESPFQEVGDHQQVLDYAIRQTTRTSTIGEFLNRLLLSMEKILLYRSRSLNQGHSSILWML